MSNVDCFEKKSMQASMRGRSSGFFEGLKCFDVLESFLDQALHLAYWDPLQVLNAHMIHPLNCASYVDTPKRLVDRYVFSQ
uniref:Uncharacterized protein n=1 Tax=Bionectria ochroleuca TaxID=29856 RepID=A0A0B7KH95_BIOOC